VHDEDVNTIMEVLFDIRRDVRHVIDLLDEDDEDGREEEEES
jgi:hypothetical protein